jgi:hypothetical protein
MYKTISENIDKLKMICKENNVAELFLFGSALKDSYSETSDLDFAVLFDQKLEPLEQGESYFRLLESLESLFNKKIDLISYKVIKNAIFKKELDNTKVSLYVAA